MLRHPRIRDGGCREAPSSPYNVSGIEPHECSKRKRMAFIVAVLLFVVVVGIVDAGLSWPDPKSRQRRP
jgi:hypothetical protein